MCIAAWLIVRGSFMHSARKARFSASNLFPMLYEDVRFAEGYASPEGFLPLFPFVDVRPMFRCRVAQSPAEVPQNSTKSQKEDLSFG